MRNMVRTLRGTVIAILFVASAADYASALPEDYAITQKTEGFRLGNGVVFLGQVVCYLRDPDTSYAGVLVKPSEFLFGDTCEGLVYVDWGTISYNLPREICIGNETGRSFFGGLNVMVGAFYIYQVGRESFGSTANKTPFERFPTYINRMGRTDSFLVCGDDAFVTHPSQEQIACTKRLLEHYAQLYKLSEQSNYEKMAKLIVDDWLNDYSSYGQSVFKFFRGYTGRRAINYGSVGIPFLGLSPYVDERFVPGKYPSLFLELLENIEIKDEESAKRALYFYTRARVLHFEDDHLRLPEETLPELCSYEQEISKYIAIEQQKWEMILLQNSPFGGANEHAEHKPFKSVCEMLEKEPEK